MEDHVEGGEEEVRSGAGDNGEEEDEQELSGREMWSEDEEVEDAGEYSGEGEDHEDQGDITFMTEGGSGGSSFFSPRAELSMAELSSVIEDDQMEEESPQSPAHKKMRMFQWTSEEEKLSPSTDMSPIEWSPVLAKIEDGREVHTVSTSSESTKDEQEEGVSPEGRVKVDSEGHVNAEQIRDIPGRLNNFPDTEVIDQAFSEVFGDQEEDSEE